MWVRQKFLEQSVVEICSLLAASHPKSTSPWAALPRAIFRLIGNFILEPLPCVFSDWHAMSVVRNQQRSLHFGLRLHSQSVFLYNSGDAGIATCGPSIHADTGVWTVEVSLSAPVQLDGFCRADLGLVLDKSDLSERCASGIWWEAGDGDVFIGKDAGGSAEGWLGGAAAVENGILPSWHEEGSRVGLVLDTDLKILGFTKAGALQHFEWKVPDYAWPVHFGVGWSADIGGQFHLLSLQHFRRAWPISRTSERRDFASITPLPEEVAKVSDLDDLALRQEILGTWARYTSLPLEALQVPMLRSSRQRLALDMAPLVPELRSLEAAILQHVPSSLELPEDMSQFMEKIRERWRRRNRRWQALAWCCG